MVHLIILTKHRPKVGICPHQEDYCDTCAHKKAEIHGKQTTINRLLQSSNADADEVKKLQDDMVLLKKTLEEHRQEAQKSHTFYVEASVRCKTEWNEILELEKKTGLNEEEKQQLKYLKGKFNLVLCADYQMCKLVPYWGMSAQPGSTYYLQKLNHDVFGIVNHATKSSTAYLFDERVGPKNTDYTVSYLTHFFTTIPDWVNQHSFVS